MSSIERAEKFLKDAGTYYLATVEGDQPRVRPFGTANIFEGKLYIQTGRKKNVSKQIKKNPKVELCAFDGKERECDDRFMYVGELYDDNSPQAGRYIYVVNEKLKKKIKGFESTSEEYIRLAALIDEFEKKCFEATEENGD